MEQTTINQRLKFLVEKLNLSSRAFSELIGESPTNTHNYIGARQAEPRASYLTNVLSHFKDISPAWLLLGEGDPFLSTPPTHTNENTPVYSTNKNFSPKQVVKGKNNTQQQMTGGTEALQRENELLRAQLADKERTIQILLSHQLKP